MTDSNIFLSTDNISVIDTKTDTVGNISGIGDHLYYIYDRVSLVTKIPYEKVKLVINGENYIGLSLNIAIDTGITLSSLRNNEQDLDFKKELIFNDLSVGNIHLIYKWVIVNDPGRITRDEYTGRVDIYI